MPEISEFGLLLYPGDGVLKVVMREGNLAQAVTINGRAVVIEPSIVTEISLEGIHFSHSWEAVRVIGLFRDGNTAIQAALIPRKFQPWDDWFADQTEAVLWAIGWNNPLIKLIWPELSGQVPTEVERRFHDRLPDRPLARRA